MMEQTFVALDGSCMRSVLRPERADTSRAQESESCRVRAQDLYSSSLFLHMVTLPTHDSRLTTLSTTNVIGPPRNEEVRGWKVKSRVVTACMHAYILIHDSRVKGKMRPCCCTHKSHSHSVTRDSCSHMTLTRMRKRARSCHPPRDRACLPPPAVLVGRELV